MRILITSGATRERIDGVRFMTNFSTGKTGAELADYFKDKRCEVFYLHGESAAMPAASTDCLEFSDFADLDGKLKLVLKKYRFDAVIHLAAVSDYSVDSLRIGSKRVKPGRLAKIDSGEEVTIGLKRNFKIIGRLANYSRNRGPRPVIVGFKLTNNAAGKQVLDAVRKLEIEGNPDIVVHNDLSEFKGGENRVFHIYEEGRRAGGCASRRKLAAKLMQIIKKRVSEREAKNASGS